jgi:hypothetical protein
MQKFAQKTKIRPMDKNSPKMLKFAQSDHPSPKRQDSISGRKRVDLFSFALKGVGDEKSLFTRIQTKIDSEPSHFNPGLPDGLFSDQKSQLG